MARQTEVRIGKIGETKEFYKIDTHWRSIFKDQPQRVDFLFSNPETEAEIRASQSAKDQLNALGYGNYL